MKIISLILNAVLIIAVAVMYFLYFSGKNTKETKSEPVSGGITQSSGNTSIAYINIDTMLVQMEMYKDLKDDLTSRQKELESSFDVKYKTFEKNVNDLQNKINKGLVTRAEAEQLNQQLANDRAQLESLNADYTQQLQEQEFVSNRKVIDYISEFLKDYTRERNIQFVFSYAFGGNLLYTDSTFDITGDVLTRLNEKYLTDKTGKK